MSNALERAKELSEAFRRNLDYTAKDPSGFGPYFSLLRDAQRTIAAIVEHLDEQVNPRPTCAYCEVPVGEEHLSDCPLK